VEAYRPRHGVSAAASHKATVALEQQAAAQQASDGEYGEPQLPLEIVAKARAASRDANMTELQRDGSADAPALAEAWAEKEQQAAPAAQLLAPNGVVGSAADVAGTDLSQGFSRAPERFWYSGTNAVQLRFAVSKHEAEPFLDFDKLPRVLMTSYNVKVTVRPPHTMPAACRKSDRCSLVRLLIDRQGQSEQLVAAL